MNVRTLNSLIVNQIVSYCWLNKFYFSKVWENQYMQYMISTFDQIKWVFLENSAATQELEPWG